MSSCLSVYLSKVTLLSRSCRYLAAPNVRFYYGHNLPISSTSSRTVFSFTPVSSVSPSSAMNKFIYRQKGKWTSKNVNDDSDDEDGVVLEKGLDFTDRRIKVPSLRIDACIKAAFKLSRNAAEKEIYANKFRINGEKIVKPNRTLMIDDVIEYLRTNSSKVNPSLAEVSTAEVRHIGGFQEAGTHYYVVFRVYQNQLIPQWNS